MMTILAKLLLLALMLPPVLTDDYQPQCAGIYESEFDIVVVGPPFIHSLQLTNGMARLEWSAVPNASYRLEVTDDLNTGSWVQAGDPVVSTDFTARADCPLAGSSQKFFRLRVGP